MLGGATRLDLNDQSVLATNQHAIADLALRRASALDYRGVHEVGNPEDPGDPARTLLNHQAGRRAGMDVDHDA